MKEPAESADTRTESFMSAVESFMSAVCLQIVLPDSEAELWLELTVEVEHSDTERLLWIASTWVLSNSKRRLRYLCSRIKFSRCELAFRSLSSRAWKKKKDAIKCGVYIIFGVEFSSTRISEFVDGAAYQSLII